jgi:hypothetical protein
LDCEFGVEGLSETIEDAKAGYGATRFKSSNGRLGHSGGSRELSLAPTTLLA